MKIVAFFGLALFMLYGFFDTLSKGSISEQTKGNYWTPSKTKVYSREKNPIRFWSRALGYLAVSLVLFIVGFWEIGSLTGVIK